MVSGMVRVMLSGRVSPWAFTAAIVRLNIRSQTPHRNILVGDIAYHHGNHSQNTALQHGNSTASSSSYIM